MKASLKFREDQKPLVRAKIPISIIGLPLLSGISAGESRDLRLDLGTAFESGPTFRVSYRPNDSWNPFTLAVKTGIGTFGSPIDAPMSMSAEFNLLARGAGNPIFSLLFKPRIGDFCFKKTAGSAKIPVDRDMNGERSIDGVETPIIRFRQENSIHSGKKANGFSTVVPAGGGIHDLLTGVEVTARSVLPLKSRAAVIFRWGVRIPAELRTAFADDGRVSTAGISLGKVPLLVMSKISIEHVAGEGKSKGKADDVTKSAADVAEACDSVKRQLEALQAENGLLRKAVEDLRSEIGGGRTAPAADSRVSCGADASKGGARPAAGNQDRRSEGKSIEISGRAAPENASEELKKARMGSGGAGI